MSSCNRKCGSCENPCLGSQSHYVCRCLGIAEHDLIEAIVNLELRTVREIRSRTGAGDGCLACHKKLKGYLEKYGPKTMPALPLAVA